MSHSWEVVSCDLNPGLSASNVFVFRIVHKKCQLKITGMGLDNYSRKEKHWTRGLGRSRRKVETEKSSWRIILALWNLPSTSCSGFSTSFCVLLWWNDSQIALWLVVKLLNLRRQKEQDGTNGLKMKAPPWLPKQGRIDQRLYTHEMFVYPLRNSRAVKKMMCEPLKKEVEITRTQHEFLKKKSC